VTTTWELRSGETLLGLVTISGGDFPWTFAHLTAAAAFAEVQPLFDRAAHLLDSGDVEAWEDAQAAVDALDLRLLEQNTGRAVIPVGLHIRGDEASFRAS
jgi:putative SOS response-associated peptidase YedK